ncbi:hypothetical protein [Glycomyces algeriensis]|jgi:hypothetical protein|uniref:Uncharacterized protein n=1 Tax=Glycomyces algeriensis TaxID=256037 RepID=A0A9W6LIM8_9ACTN|nr:hypothetical protein [Glycomyces algeriensis]MDA1365433.1 hypothetical protein [Glycomyces algeriensis]MDR7351118.1 hypothetical protein [Glycomyces algeriensis]GLI43831.1 hypothetical protein GALLR39Z86_36810 [Glycomyces algeriensis]
MNSALKKHMRRASAMLAGLAMAATLAGVTVAGTAAAAPAVAQAEAASTVTGEYAATRGKLYGTWRSSTRCVEVAQWLRKFESITDAWCLQGNAMGTVWHVYYEGTLV